MTFSIVACDSTAGDWGVAVASKFPAVGAVAPWAAAGAGAVATQAWANVSYGPSGLAMLAENLAAEDVLSSLLEDDEAVRDRQVGLVDRLGRAASFTGEGCMPWAGGITGDGFACQGNILTGPEVVQAMARTFEDAAGDLVDRLLAALSAGEAAGGDRRGKQSAALLVAREGGGYGGRSDRYVDLRVDDHSEPVRELLRVFSVYDREYLVRQDPLVVASPEAVRDLQARLRSLGRYDGPIDGDLDGATRDALAGFAGVYNLEAKIRDDDQLHESLIRELRDVTPEIEEDAGAGRRSG